MWKRLYEGRLESANPGEGKEVDCGIMFADIARFTSMVENMSPEKTFQLLTSYMSCLGPIIERHNGYVDKYLGDGVLAIFDRDGHYKEDTISCAIDIIGETRKYNQREKDQPNIEMRVGANCGRVMLGTVGFSRRMEFTVLGDAVNSASRIEEMTRRYGVSILVDQLLLSDDFQVQSRYIGNVQPRGKKRSLNLVEVFAADVETNRSLKIGYRDDFDEALRLREAGERDKSREIFSKILDLNPEDSVCSFFLEIEK